jgi:hypothetical protein
MHSKFTIFRALLISLLPLLNPSLHGEDVSEQGRKIFAANQRVVVTVQLVLKSKISMPGVGGQSSESRQDATGTVVSPSGLTVLSLSVTDPAQLLQGLGAGDDNDSRFKMETELSDVKILLDDGTEVPAEVVLRDRDLDLAFIRPKAPLASPLPALDLAQSGKADILDQVIALNRLGSAAGRAYAASVERISAIVRRPRLYYIPDSTMTTTTLGSPAFTLDGKPLGIFVTRVNKSRSGGGMGMFNFQADSPTQVIVPIADILKAVKQVPAVSEEKAKEKP